jgi:hypothetical protein
MDEMDILVKQMRVGCWVKGHGILLSIKATLSDELELTFEDAFQDDCYQVFRPDTKLTCMVTTSISGAYN